MRHLVTSLLFLSLWAFATPNLSVERLVNPSVALPGQTVSVEVVIRNSGAAGSYRFTETLPADVMLLDSDGSMANSPDGPTLVWSGNIGSGVELRHRYRFETSCSSSDILQWHGEMSPTAERFDALLPLALLNTFLSSPSPRLGEPFELEVTVQNPLPQAVVLTLETLLPEGMTLLAAPEAVVLAPAEERTLILTLQAEGLERALVQVIPAADGIQACQAARSSLNFGAVAGLPESFNRTTLTFDIGSSGVNGLQGLIFAVSLPEDSAYLAQTALFAGESLAEPEIAATTLFFRLPPRDGLLSFELLSESALDLTEVQASLIALSPLPELLTGQAEVLTLLETAAPVEAAFLPERSGARFLAPAPGTLLRDRDAVTVSVDTPLGSPVTLTINGVGVPDEQIGQRTLDSGLNRQTYDYIGVQLQPGTNRLELSALTAEGETLTDTLEVFLAGAPATVTLTPRTPLIANSPTALEIDIEVRDAFGYPPLDDFLTLELRGAEPLTPDATPQDFGYQLRYVNGRARLSLQAPPVPTTLRLRVRLIDTVIERTLDVMSEQRPWLVNAQGSVGLGLSPFALAARAEVFARGSLSHDTLLTFALRLPGAPLGLYGNPYERFPVTGASSVLSQNAFSRDGVFIRLEQNLSYVQYGDFVTLLDGTLSRLSRSYTGLSAVYEPGGLGLFGNAYAAYVPTARQVNDLEIPSDGTSLYRLPQAPIEAGSLQLSVIKRNRFDNRLIETGDDPLVGDLTALRDYQLDETLGLIFLSRPLPLSDIDGNPYSLRLSYRIRDGEEAGRRWQFGVQGGYRLAIAEEGTLELQASAYQETRESGSVRLVAVGSSLVHSGIQADVEVAYGADNEAGGVGVAAGISYSDETLSANLRYQYLSEGYRSADVRDAQTSGHSLQGEARFSLSPDLALSFGGRLQTRPERFEYDLRSLAEYNSGAIPGFSSGSRLQFGLQSSNSGTRLLIGVSAQDPLGIPGNLSLTHAQGLGSTSITDLSLSYRLFESLELVLTERVEWGVGHSLSVGLRSRFSNADLFGAAADFGSTELRAQYDLGGGLSSTAGRARLGVSTSVPITDEISLEGSIEQTLGLGDAAQNATVFTAAGRYDGDTLDAQLRYELRLASAVKHVLSGGVNMARDEHLFFSINGTYLFDSAQTQAQGFTLSAAAAYRGVRFNLLTNHELYLGNFATPTRGTLQGDVRAIWDLDPVALSLGYNYRYGDNFEDIISLGLQFGLWDGGRLGGFARLYHDWTGGQLALGGGLEVSQRLGCGLYGVVGYNVGAIPEGFLGQQGLQLRLDAAIDEQWRCGARRYSFAGRAAVDLNRSGSWDEGEPLLANVQTTLYRADGSPVASITTDAMGIYSFRDIPEGDYYLSFSLPEGFAYAAHYGLSLDARVARTAPFRLESNTLPPLSFIPEARP